MVEFPVAVPVTELPLVTMHLTNARAGENQGRKSGSATGTSDMVTRQARQE